MIESIPMQFAIPALIVGLVVVLVLGFLMLSSKKRVEIIRTDSFTEPLMAYEIPEDYGTMALEEKRLVTIQNLYLNYREDLESIATLLEVDKRFVEEVLLRTGHIHKDLPEVRSQVRLSP